MFKEFLKQYIRDLVENSFVEYELDDDIINDVADIVADDESIWNVIDEAICFELEPYEKKKDKKEEEN